LHHFTCNAGKGKKSLKRGPDSADSEEELLARLARGEGSSDDEDHLITLDAERGGRGGAKKVGAVKSSVGQWAPACKDGSSLHPCPGATGVPGKSQWAGTQSQVALQLYIAPDLLSGELASCDNAFSLPDHCSQKRKSDGAGEAGGPKKWTNRECRALEEGVLAYGTWGKWVVIQQNVSRVMCPVGRGATAEERDVVAGRVQTVSLLSGLATKNLIFCTGSSQKM
jgi:hypothetical protein